MNAIELLLEALKATTPCISDYATVDAYLVAADMHNKAIAAGEAELAREPDAWMLWNKRDEEPVMLYFDKPDGDFKDHFKLRNLYTREEIK